MFTILLAWINAHYDCGYFVLFAGTVIIDILFFEFLSELVSK